MEKQGTTHARILVVEDDEVLRELLPPLLDLHLEEVHVVGSGQEAVTWLNNSQAPELILTDMQMAGLEGGELISALRAAAPADTLLIGMSASTPAGSTTDSLDAFVSKPFTARDLETAIQTAQNARERRLPGSDGKASPAPTSPGTPGREQPPILDEAIFSAMAEKFQPDVLGEIYSMTLNDVAQRLQRIGEYAAAGDLDALRREAHAMKGGCAWVGARELAQMAAAAEVETTINTSAIADFPAACDRLRRLLDVKLQQ